MGWWRADLLGSRVVFTDRRGGTSRPPFDSLNLGLAEGDDPAAVGANRTRVARAAGIDPAAFVSIRQVHGTGVEIADPAGRAAGPVDADAVVVTEPGPAALILTADCAPLALLGQGGSAAVHGGWRGLLAGVIDEAVGAMAGVGAEPTLAVLGPCIRSCCYEFGDSDLDTMAARFGAQVRSRTRAGASALDLAAVVRAALTRAGVGRFLDLDRCTACSPDWFSYRRDGRTGRQGLVVTRVVG